MYNREQYVPHVRRARRKKTRAFVVLACLLVGCIGAAVYTLGATHAHTLAAPGDVSLAGVEQMQPSDVAFTAPAQAEDVVLTLNGSKETYVLAGEEYLEAGVHAVQRDVGVITNSVTTKGAVDTAKPGDYEVTYTATTSTGAQASTTRTVHVVESMEKASTLPVLMYHWVYSADDPPADLDGNYILDTDLAEQLQYLQENNYYYPSFQEVRAFAEGTHSLPAKSVVLTFDDGEWGFLKLGVPLLNQYKVPATSFVISADGDIYNKTEGCASEYVRFQSHSYNMHRAGSNVGRGGILHAMSREQIMEDADKAKEILGEVEALAYPFGDNNETAWKALSDSGILCAFTIKNARVAPGDNPMALSRVRISGGNSLGAFIKLVS